MIAKNLMNNIETIEEINNLIVLDENTNIFEINDSLLENDKIYFKNGDTIVGQIRSSLIKYVKKTISRNFLLSILEDIQEAIIAVDSEGRVFYANQRYTEVLGVPIKNVIGKYLTEIEKEATIIRVLKNRKAIDKSNNYIRSINKYVDVKIRPIYIDKQFFGAYSIFKDVTLITNLNKKVDRVSKLAEEYNNQLFAQKKLKELNVIGKSPNYLRVVSKAINVSKTEASVLLLGENGTGKDVISQLIYKNSNRSDKPFVTLNCAAIPESLIESEMFGYEEGAFTGAQKSGKLGKFELADNGTIFLDEIADMSLSMQAKLLRVLETGEIEKIGSEKRLKVNVRVISATNKNLEELIEKGEFREDLYYRLSVITLNLPSLRDREHDKTLFINHFLDYYNNQYNKEAYLSKEALEILENYSWPGNIRELKNCIEHSVILSDTGKIEREHLPKRIRDIILDENKSSLEHKLDSYEKRLIQDSILLNKSNLDSVADELKISTRTLYRKMKKYGLELTNLS